jgi:hypothetical protein
MIVVPIVGAENYDEYSVAVLACAPALAASILRPLIGFAFGGLFHSSCRAQTGGGI